MNRMAMSNVYNSVFLNMRFLFSFLPLFCFLATKAQPTTDSLMQTILLRNSDTLFQRILSQPDRYRLQIIYTQIDRDKHNKPTFINHHFHTDPQAYYYPASVVKLPLAALSLEKINELQANNVKVDKFTSLLFDSAYPHQVAEVADSTAETGLPSIAHFIKKVFLISDNDAYNRMYQFVGQQTINRKLHTKGYPNTRITRQFMGFTEDENRHTNPIRFLDRNGKELYRQPMAFNTDSFDFSHPVYVGKAYYNRNDSLISEPMSFTRHNTIPLEDLQQMLQSILFPASVPVRQRFNLTAADDRFLLQYLSQYPSETSYPKYDTAQYYDSYVKFFFLDTTHRMPPQLRVFNKVGWSYGFLTDVSYVADFKHKIEYMLTATVYVNRNDTLNDDHYEYEQEGRPFLYQLGQTIYHYELQRTRDDPPDLRRFVTPYDHRDPADTRPSVKDADN